MDLGGIYIGEAGHYNTNNNSCYFLTIFSAPGARIIKLITAVIYSFGNKLEHLSLNSRLGWKGLPGTNTLAYYGNCKLRP
jgi:hypothetical protein